MGLQQSVAADLVAYLERSSPESIAALRNRFPENKQLLSSAKSLGTESAVARSENTEQDQTAFVDLLKSSTVKLEADTDELIAAIKTRMTLVHRTKLIGGLIAATSGALTAFLASASAPDQTTALATALVATVGGLLTVVADYFERSPSGIRIASAEEYGKLLDARSSLARISRQISQTVVAPLSLDDLHEKLAETNTVAEHILRLKFA